MSRRERDVLKVMSLVLEGKRTQVEASRLLDLSNWQVRRIQMRHQKKEDVCVVHRRRGKPSNRRLNPSVRKKALTMVRKELVGFHPKHAWQKLIEAGLKLSTRALHGWLAPGRLGIPAATFSERKSSMGRSDNGASAVSNRRSFHKNTGRR